MSAKATTSSQSGGFSDDEKAAMRERAKEVKAGSRKGGKVDGEADLLAKVAEMPTADRVMAERIHAIVSEVAPVLEPKTWYGMPAWALDGKVVCFFKSADKFKSRYATFGFEEQARIDEGTMWPTSFGITKLTKTDESLIAALVKRAVG